MRPSRPPGMSQRETSQVRQLAIDNVVNDGSMTLDDLGIDPTAAEVVLPEMLEYYRRGGPYAKIQPV